MSRARRGRRTGVVDPAVSGTDHPYERMRARLLAALADHERGELDHAGLQAAVEDLRGTLGNGHREVSQALFEADVALDEAQPARGPGLTPAVAIWSTLARRG